MGPSARRGRKTGFRKGDLRGSGEGLPPEVEEGQRKAGQEGTRTAQRDSDKGRGLVGWSRAPREQGGFWEDEGVLSEGDKDEWGLGEGAEIPSGESLRGSESSKKGRGKVVQRRAQRRVRGWGRACGTQNCGSGWVLRGGSCGAGHGASPRRWQYLEFTQLL